MYLEYVEEALDELTPETWFQNQMMSDDGSRHCVLGKAHAIWCRKEQRSIDDLAFMNELQIEIGPGVTASIASINDRSHSFEEMLHDVRAYVKLLRLGGPFPSPQPAVEVPQFMKFTVVEPTPAPVPELVSV